MSVRLWLFVSEMEMKNRAFFTAEYGRRQAGNRSRLNNQALLSNALLFIGGQEGEQECPCD